MMHPQPMNPRDEELAFPQTHPSPTASVTTRALALSAPREVKIWLPSWRALLSRRYPLETNPVPHPHTVKSQGLGNIRPHPQLLPQHLRTWVFGLTFTWRSKCLTCLLEGTAV